MVASGQSITAAKMPKAQMGSLKGPKQANPKLPEGEARPKMLDSAQIIIQFFTQQTGSPQKANQILSSLAGKIKKNEVKLVQIGNTVFICMPKPDKSVEVFTVTIEPDKLADRIKSSATTLKQMGFSKMYTLSITPQSDEISKKTGLPVKKTQTQMMSNGKMVPAYRYEVQL